MLWNWKNNKMKMRSEYKKPQQLKTLKFEFEAEK